MVFANPAIAQNVCVAWHRGRMEYQIDFHYNMNISNSCNQEYDQM